MNAKKISGICLTKGSFFLSLFFSFFSFSDETIQTLQRPATIKVDARDVTGARFKINLSGLAARVFQHEFDHLKVYPLAFLSVYR